MMQNYKTFSEISILYPIQLYDGTNVDAYTQNLIYNWFEHRYICDDIDEKWLVFFHRLLNEKYAKYKIMSQVESIDNTGSSWDWFKNELEFVFYAFYD